jgi:tetratricopeptide (TPR) repeat protein
VFTKAQAQLLLGDETDAMASWQRCLEMGDAPARYGATVGSGTYLPMLALADLHRRRGEAQQARALLERCIDEHPTFVGTVGPYAGALLEAGLDAEAAVREIEQRVSEPTPSTRFMLADALRAHGALAAAVEQYRSVLARRPANSHVRVTLAETLLDAGHYEEAAQVARGVGDEDPFAALAARIETWAAIAGGRFGDVAAARARLGRTGVSAAEQEVFDAWAAAAHGRPAAAVGVAGAPLLGVILEALLRNREFTAFERLVAVLEASALPRREQRELLARMYLRYGFLQAAAREWMAVCEHEPDARALLGLARVAAAHGLPEEAATFAGQALVLDPGCDEARALAPGAATPVA